MLIILIYIPCAICCVIVDSKLKAWPWGNFLFSNFLTLSFLIWDYSNIFDCWDCSFKHYLFQSIFVWKYNQFSEKLNLRRKVKQNSKYAYTYTYTFFF